MTVIAAAPRCDANAYGKVAGQWGMEALPCQTRVGLRSFTDQRGEVRRFCAAPEHESNAKRRFGVAPLGCFICHGPLFDDYRTFSSNGAIVAVCGPCQDKADPE